MLTKFWLILLSFGHPPQQHFFVANVTNQQYQLYKCHCSSIIFETRAACDNKATWSFCMPPVFWSKAFQPPCGALFWGGTAAACPTQCLPQHMSQENIYKCTTSRSFVIQLPVMANFLRPGGALCRVPSTKWWSPPLGHWCGTPGVFRLGHPKKPPQSIQLCGDLGCRPVSVPY